MTIPKPQLRVLLLLDKNADDNEQEMAALVEHASTALAARRPEFDIVLTTSHDAYAIYGLTETTMDGYARRVARGTSPATGQPLFHAFVRIGTTCGRGTADIVRIALTARKQAFVIGVDGAFLPIYGVEPTTGEWGDGYGLRTTPYLTLDE